MHISTIGNLDGDVWRMILDNLDWPRGTAGAKAVEADDAAPSDAALRAGVLLEEPAAQGSAP